MQTSRCFPNDLQPIPLDEQSLIQTRETLRQAIADAVTLIEAKAHSAMDHTIYTGTTGLAVMYLRLEKQASALNLNLESTHVSSFRQLAGKHLSSPDMPIPRPGRLSPIDSVVGLATTSTILNLSTGSSPQRSNIDILELALQAVEKDTTKTNELLYGKAGLLFSLLQLRGALGNPQLSPRLSRLTSEETLGHIIDLIINEGTSAAFSEDAPLHFEWHGKCYLGAMHGLAGILTVLLQCPLSLIDKHRPLIIRSINWLIKLTIDNDGVLPPGFPARYRFSEPLVQICHGSPGLLLLLATLQTMRQDWVAEVDERMNKAVALASDHVWEQGLVVKGLGVCHGVTGNAWPWLLVSQQKEGDNKKDTGLGRALAFLVHSTELPPMTRHSRYRTPDHPCSLFEGLAGAVCCWSEACVLITSLLKENAPPVLGMPCIGGVGITGLL